MAELTEVRQNEGHIGTFFFLSVMIQAGQLTLKKIQKKGKTLGVDRITSEIFLCGGENRLSS